VTSYVATSVYDWTSTPAALVTPTLYESPSAGAAPRPSGRAVGFAAVGRRRDADADPGVGRGRSVERGEVAREAEVVAAHGDGRLLEIGERHRRRQVELDGGRGAADRRIGAGLAVFVVVRARKRKDDASREPQAGPKARAEQHE
jgi:hypothetical protein